MALDSFANLQLAIGAELNRGDLANVVPDFITRAEARFRRELKDWLRSTLTATNVVADYLLPVTVSDVLSVAYNDGTNGAHNFSLDLVDRENYQGWMELESIPVATAGQLCYVDADVDGATTTLRFWPPATASGPIANLKIEVIKTLLALSATQTTNSLLRDAPDLYLYGALAESAAYLQHDERIPIWEARTVAGVKALRILSERRLYGGAPRRRTFSRVFG